MWLNASVSTTSLPIGGYSYQAIAHELGHAVGLSHPGQYNAELGVSITYAANAQFVQDTNQYTVMSYFDESDTTGSYGSYPDTLMLFDVYALQRIYGANTATRSTNTVYGFNSNAGGVYNFTTNTNPALCIWDGGGIDTLDVSGFLQSQRINLNGGTFSDIGGRTGNISIALNCTIENAVGGSGADRIYLSNLSVNNVVNGGGGTDRVHVSYNYNSDYTLSGTAGNFTMSGAAGTDTLRNVEFVVFASGQEVSAANLVASQPAGSISISDVSISEGSGGSKMATFTLTRTAGSSAFTVNYATANGTASAGSDYAAASGTLSFAAGVNTKTVSVTVFGDIAAEPNETFFVNLSGATNGAVLSDAQGKATITNDDALALSGVSIDGTNLADKIDAAHGVGGSFPSGRNDALHGLDGNDILEGLGGGDFLDGGTGIDYASYRNAPLGSPPT